MKLRHSVVLLLALILAVPLALVPAGVRAQDDTTTITILQTTDLHGNLMPFDYYANKEAEWGLAKVASVIARERATDPNALLIDTGDTIQGTPLSYYYALIDKNAPHPMALTMNALRYDVAALGNHEFNYGLDTLDRFISQAQFPILSANTRKTDGSEAYGSYIIKEVNGVKVGILGLTTPAIPNWEKPENIAGLRFDNPVATALQYVPQMRAAGADIIVVNQHTGWEKIPAESGKPESWLTDPSGWQDSGSLPGENVSVRLAQEVPGIDVILSGHSHLNVPKALINGVLVVEASYWGRALGKVTLKLQKSGDSWQVVTKDSTTIPVTGVAPDPQQIQLSAPYHNQTIQYISTPIGNSTGEFAGGPRARYTDSALADLINTVQTEAAAAAGYPVDISLAAIFNDTGMIPQGQIALRDAYSVYIYDNTLYVLEINGDILRRALEKNAEYFSQVDPAKLPADPKGMVPSTSRDYNWDIYTGIDYTIDITKPAGQRVTQLKFKGQDVTPQQRFRIAINNYRASGGGGFGMFREGTRVWASTNEIRDLMAAYVTAKGTISPQAINTKNFTLVPDLYATYYGGPAQPAPAPAPGAGSTPQRPVSLPNTAGEPLALWPLAALALALTFMGLSLRRRVRG